MSHGDFTSSGQIGDGSRHFQNAVECSGREVQALGGGLEQRFGGIVQLSEFPDLGGSHFRVAKEAQLLKTIALDRSCEYYPFAQLPGVFSRFLIHQLFVLHRRHFHKDVHPVEQQPADSFLIVGTMAGEQVHSVRGCV